MTTPDFRPLSIHILTVSDTRNQQEDHSGSYLAQALQEAGHTLHSRDLCRDERYDIRAQLDPRINACGFTRLFNSWDKSSTKAA